MDYPRKGLLKYVVFENGEMVVVFPSLLDHDTVSQSMEKSIYKTFMEPMEPTSAGFCSITDKGWWCRGKSVTLKLESAEGDAELLEKWYPVDGEGE